MTLVISGRCVFVVCRLSVDRPLRDRSHERSTLLALQAEQLAALARKPPPQPLSLTDGGTAAVAATTLVADWREFDRMAAATTEGGGGNSGGSGGGGGGGGGEGGGNTGFDANHGRHSRTTIAA